jgi:hypothetical protein
MPRLLRICKRLLALALTALPNPPAQAQTLKPAPPVPGKTEAQPLALMRIASKCYAGLQGARLDSLRNGPPR